MRSVVVVSVGTSRACRPSQSSAAGFAYRAQNEEIAYRHGHPYPSRHSPGVFPHRRMFFAGLIGPDNGCTAFRLNRKHLRHWYRIAW